MPARYLGSPSSLAPFGYLFLYISTSSLIFLDSGDKAAEAWTGQREYPEGPTSPANMEALLGGWKAGS